MNMYKIKKRYTNKIWPWNNSPFLKKNLKTTWEKREFVNVSILINKKKINENTLTIKRDKYQW